MSPSFFITFMLDTLFFFYMTDYDSLEEVHFSWYLEQLVEAGVIKYWKYHPKPFILSDKVSCTYEMELKTKIVNKEIFLLHDHEYTADFIIYWNPSYEGIFFYNISNNKDPRKAYFVAQKEKNYTVVDVKGQFIGPRNTTAVTFPLNQKWVYQKYGILVQKVIPKKLFHDTFVPDRYLLTDVSMKNRKVNGNKRTLYEYLDLFKV